MSHVKIYFFAFFYKKIKKKKIVSLKKLDKVVELVGGGSVINGADHV